MTAALIKKWATYATRGDGAVAQNSVDIDNGQLVSKSGEFAKVAVSGEQILGISNTMKVFDSDNQTVDQDRIVFTRVYPEDELTIETSADPSSLTINQFFNLNADGEVDITTGTAYASFVDTQSGAAEDPVVYKQVQLLRLLENDTTQAVFRVVHI